MGPRQSFITALLLALATTASATNLPPVVQVPALLCASILQPLEWTRVDAPENLDVILATPRFLITRDGDVRSRAEGFAELGRIDFFLPSNNDTAHLPLHFHLPFREGASRIPGLGTETKFARMKEAFETRGVESITAYIYHSNAASQALHRKLGFELTVTGNVQHYTLTRQGFEDLLRRNAGLNLEEFVTPRGRYRVQNEIPRWPDPDSAERAALFTELKNMRSAMVADIEYYYRFEHYGLSLFGGRPWADVIGDHERIAETRRQTIETAHAENLANQVISPAKAKEKHGRALHDLYEPLAQAHALQALDAIGHIDSWALTEPAALLAQLGDLSQRDLGNGTLNKLHRKALRKFAKAIEENTATRWESRALERSSERQNP